MDTFIKNADVKIAIGSNCYCKKFIREYTNTNESMFFDSFGISIKGLIKIFEEDFKNVFKPEFFSKKLGLKFQSQAELANEYYEMVVFHDVKSIYSEKKKEKFMNKLKYMKEKLFKRIEESNSIIFVRYEEEMDNRIVPDKSYDSEIPFIQQFLQMMRERYPNKDFRVLYFSVKHQSMYLSDGIQIVNIPYNVTYKECDTVMIDKLKEALE